jgi:histidinol-phosphate/aromatic aminotransferase/cobyric acid decarboxylase-like protein/imidazoleglycerol phosphate dehydratase HisB
VRALVPGFAPYVWAPSTADLAREAGLDPTEIVRFDGNVPPLPLPTSRPGAVAGALARVNEYPPGGSPQLVAAIAAYAGVEQENVVLGAGADDLILLSARTFAGGGDTVAIADEPTYSLFRVAAELAGADVGDDDPVLTFCCRPNNPTGLLEPLPSARPLVVDEAYFEYAGESAVDLLADGIVVLRTFSKAFGLAGARVGYALADADTAAELRRRQDPAPVSTLSAALAAAALADPPDVSPQVEERERLAARLRELGLQPLPSRASFVFVPIDEPEALAAALLRDGLVVRVVGGGVRISVRDREDDDLLLAAIERAPGRTNGPSNTVSHRSTHRRSARHLRATAETRIAVRLGLDGAGRVRVATGAGLYDHLLEQLAFHGGLDLVLEGAGDLETGDHHTAEDAALALGEALDRALGDRRGIARYGDAVVPMDDALARAAVDLGGRPWAELAIEPDPGLAAHVLGSLSQAGRLAVHVEATGRDAHHTAEAAFKAVGRALRAAVTPGSVGIPSTKGRL